MPGVIAAGVELAVPGRLVVNFRDDPRVRLAMGEDGRRRPDNTWVRQLMLHTTRGIPGGRDLRPQIIRPGRGPATWPHLNLAEMWRRDDEYSGAHLLVDHDCTIYCMADVLDELTYNATAVNATCIGIEIKQGGDAELYDEQLDAVADLVDVLTMYREGSRGIVLATQRQIPRMYPGRPIARLDESGATRGADCVGVFGHRDQTRRRGAGDPGHAVMARLVDRGYATFDFDAREDQTAWRERQSMLGLAADGIPGPKVSAALAARGFAGGLWACPPPGLAELVGL